MGTRKEKKLKQKKTVEEEDPTNSAVIHEVHLEVPVVYFWRKRFMNTKYFNFCGSRGPLLWYP